MNRFIILLLLVVFPSTLTFSQSTIKGKVIDKMTNLPLIGATVLIKGTADGTTTNIDGNFSLKIPSFPTTLITSYTGFISVKSVVKDTSFLNVEMELDSTISIIGHYITIYADAPVNIRMPAPLMQLFTRQLDRDNDVDISPILNRVPGVYMHSGALNTNRVTIRGIGNRSLFSTAKIRAYLDDIPLTTGDGETTIEDIDRSVFDKIEIWKGPTASMYGAGLGGMIHLKTRNNWTFAGENYVSSKTTFGSYGLLRNSSSFSFSNKKNTASIKLNYNTTHSDGYRENNEYDRSGLTLLGKLKENKKNVTTLLVNFINVKAFIPSSLSQSDFDENPQKAAFTWGNIKGFEDYGKLLLGISHKTEITQFSDSRLTNSTSIFGSFREAYESRPFNILDEKSQSLGFRTLFNLDQLVDETMRPFPNLTVGLEAFQENYKWKTFVTNDGILGDELSDNLEKRNYINLFFQSYFDFGDKWSLIAGVNYNHTSYDYEDQFDKDSIDLSGDYSFDWIVSPKVGVTYEILNDLTVFGTASHGFSPPSLEETLTPDGAINPEIQPEKGWNFEIGSRGRVWNNNLTFEVSAYQMQIKDLLVAERVGADQFIGINAGETRHTGIETFVEYQFPINYPSRLSVFMTYSYNDYKFIDFVNGDNDFSGNKLTGTAPHNLNLGVDWKFNQGIYGNLNYQYVDAFPMRDDNSIDSKAYQVMNLKIGYRKLFTNKFQLDIFAGVRNLLDEKYASMILINAGSFGGNPPRYFYPGLPRNYFGGINLKYYFP